MNEKIKKSWIKALLSKKFKQGRGELKTSDGRYCCLGVLCELHRRDHNKTHKKKLRWDRPDGEGMGYCGVSGTLPEKVMDWADLGSDNPNCDGVLLSDYNDGNNIVQVGPKSFRAIASLIEKCL